MNPLRTVNVLAIAFLLAWTNFALAQAPYFNYSAGSKNYTTGTTISPLTPISGGGPVPATVYGQVTTFAGDGNFGTANGTGTSASLSSPVGVSLDKDGNLYVTNYY